MKVLLIIKGKTPVPQTTMWDALTRLCDVERVEFGDDEMSRYAQALTQFDFSRYNRVLLDQNIQRIGRQYPALRPVPNLVFLEQDACQHFIRESAWYGRYAPVFRDIGCVRVLVSNRTCEMAFRAAGVDCAYLPKAFDENAISNLRRPRDVEFGYIGRVNHAVYAERRRLLEAVEKPLNLQRLRSEFGDRAAYNNLLNRIRFFVSADIGMNEYMFKNFEAMAAGCVLMAKRQPEIEQQALGFADMENVVLYDDATGLIEKAQQLRNDTALADRIAAAGQALVESRHTMSRRATELFQLLQAPIQPAPSLSRVEKVRHFWSRPFWQ
jgi:hypothetical protein